MYVLDTNTVIFLFKGEASVAERLLGLRPSDVGLPAVVLYELEVGAARSAAPDRRRQQLKTLLGTMQVLPFGIPEAQVAARIRTELERVGEAIGPLDTLIAATAMANWATLVTHNVREFSRVTGLQVEDWHP